MISTNWPAPVFIAQLVRALEVPDFFFRFLVSPGHSLKLLLHKNRVAFMFSPSSPS